MSATVQEAREFRAYDHMPAEELVREVERIAVAIFLWPMPTDRELAVSWEALITKQKAAQVALLRAVRAERTREIVEYLTAYALEWPTESDTAGFYNDAASKVAERFQESK